MMDATQNKIYRTKLLETYKRAIKIFDELGIEWYAAYGTAIGAARHNGIIPWDDDVDLYVTYKDYVRLLKLEMERYQQYGLSIITCKDKNNPFPFIKICDNNSTIWEKDEYLFAHGVAIDIFPLVDTNITLDSFVSFNSRYMKLVKNYTESVYNLNWSLFLNDILLLRLGTVRRKLNYLLHSLKNTNKIITALEALQKECYQPTGKFYYVPTNSKTTVTLFPKEFFNPYVEMPFEDTVIRMPHCYDAILKQYFGDYMTPPPPNDRNTYHYTKYLNLSEKLCFKEVLSRYKSGEKIKI